MNNILEKLKNTRILAAIGIVCLILGTFFTYLKAGHWNYSYTLTLSRYWEGKIVILLAFANLLFIFKDLIEKYVPVLFKNSLGEKIAKTNNPKLSLIPTLLSVALVVYLQISLSRYSSFIEFGLGFYLLWLGVICLIAYAFIHRKDYNQN